MRTLSGFASAAHLASVCAAAILMSGLVHWGGVPLSWAAPFKSVQVRPSPPRFVPRVVPRLSEPVVPGNKALSAYVPSARTMSTHEAFGRDPLPALDAKRKPFHLPNGSELRWIPSESIPTAPKVPPPNANRYPKLREWYAPAADLASQRPSRAAIHANKVRRDFETAVSEIEFVDVRQAATATVATQHSAEQLTIRLLAAAFEEEHRAQGSRDSEDAVKRRLVDALRSADNLGSRPIGSRVWGDLLATEFPPSIYQPKIQVSDVDAAGIVNYRVDSWLLPGTQTQVNVDAYAKKQVEEHRMLETIRNLVESSPPK